MRAQGVILGARVELRGVVNGIEVSSSLTNLRFTSALSGPDIQAIPLSGLPKDGVQASERWPKRVLFFRRLRLTRPLCNRRD